MDAVLLGAPYLNGGQLLQGGQDRPQRAEVPAPEPLDEKAGADDGPEKHDEGPGGFGHPLEACGEVHPGDPGIEGSPGEVAEFPGQADDQGEHPVFQKPQGPVQGLRQFPAADPGAAGDLRGPLAQSPERAYPSAEDPSEEQRGDDDEDEKDEGAGGHPPQPRSRGQEAEEGFHPSEGTEGVYRRNPLGPSAEDLVAVAGPRHEGQEGTLGQQPYLVRVHGILSFVSGIYTPYLIFFDSF